ncbi:tetratricopeptide repeat protein [Leptospira gomenensis]|uniref:tetratricopeptide repeat protein n=1 Tax=Leptospira gomenensis TaxID=2484974 RepID=UPI00143828E2|nr:tetratricopeptide repeat protein [Leptospira gomenensis]
MFIRTVLIGLFLHSAYLRAQDPKESSLRLLDSNRFEEVVSANRNLCEKTCGNPETKELVSQMEGTNSAVFCNRLGVAYMGMQDFKRAIAAFKNAIFCDDSSKHHSNLALAYTYDKDHTSAEIHYKKAMDLSSRNPDDSLPKINYSIMLIKKKEYSNSESILRETVTNKDHLFYAELFLGYTLYQQKKFTEALSHYDRGIGLNPNYADLYVYRAYAHFQLNQLTSAEMDLNQAETIRSEGVNPRIHQLRSLIQRRIQGNRR